MLLSKSPQQIKSLQLASIGLSGKAVIFDFGGVVSKTMFETHRLTEQALGLEPESLQWLGPFDTSTDPLWVSMQNDEITERDYWGQRALEIGKQAGQDWSSMQEFVIASRAADPSAVIRDEALKSFELLKAAGCRLAILSNELDLFYGADFKSKLSFLKFFDVIVDATYTKILKPNPKAYEICLDQLDMKAEDCVFVDDQARNIQGAKEVGLHTVHFDVRAPQKSYQDVLDSASAL